MLRTRIVAWTLLTLVVAVGVGVVVRVAIAQRPTVKKVEGHLAPLSVKVTFPDGKTKIAPLVSMGQSDVKCHSHTLRRLRCAQVLYSSRVSALLRNTFPQK